MPRFCLKNDKIIDMKLEKLPEEFVQAKPVLEKIIEHGFEAYFVGGSVRDILLGILQQVHIQRKLKIFFLIPLMWESNMEQYLF